MTILLLLTYGICSGQNLVPNPSFEDTLSCPIRPDGTYPNVPFSCQFWYNPTNASPDYLNACAPHIPLGNRGVPNNFPYLGWQYPRTGNAYVFLGLLNSREFIQTNLITPLIANHKYCVEFFLNMPNASNTLCKNMGMYFSSSPILFTSSLSYIGLNPQIRDTFFISDTLNWVSVVGEFIASGGEQYITMGNFTPLSIGDTINISNPYIGTGYYIDDVSVWDCTGSGIGIIEEEEWTGQTNIYPNPAMENITIDIFGIRQHTVAYDVFIKQVTVLNSFGEKVMQVKFPLQPRPGECTLSVDFLPQGVYFAEIITDKVIFYKKIMKQ